jgi:hypothetical protein
MKKFSKFLISAILVCLIGFIYYYVTLPAINIHSTGFWIFIIIVAVLLTGFFGIISSSKEVMQNKQLKFHVNKASIKGKLFSLFGLITAVLVIIFILGNVLSSPIVNAKKYQKLIDINNNRDFNKDIEQISFNEIPVLDKDSAALLGSRKMGSMVEYASQFEVADNYTQINYQNVPTRVTPLKYASIFKWLTNRSEGIPAYIRINMATQNAECVKLKEGIKYSESEHFGRYINRFLRFRFPTYMFDTINFEIDDNGVPYWICPVKDYKIGLFGGQTISNVVIVNAVTGQYTNYKIKDCPQWVDRVYSAELLVSYYNYYATLKHGYINTLFAQKDCLKATEGYNYIALEDDVWVYTGVTSVVSDESLVGFVLMNQRTAETRYYSISGAKEYSAMSSAEGKVQHLNYKATFPLLLNISGEPTYFIALKDSAGLVKDYAMVNIAKYNIVAIGDTITKCEEDYRLQLKENNITASDTESASLPTASGVIQKIAEAVVDGNSHYYIMLQGNDKIFDVSVGDNIGIIKYNVGDTITFTYTESDSNVSTVYGIK